MMYPWPVHTNFHYEQPKVQYAPVQPTYFPVPSYPHYPSSKPGPNAGLFTTILTISLIVFFVWDLALSICNYKTVLKFLEMHDVSLTIAVVFLLCSAVLKLYSVIIGTITLFGPENAGLQIFETLQIITICINAAGVIYLMTLTVGVLMPGTIGGLLFDFLLHGVVAAFSALLWKEYKPASGWILVPQSVLNY